MQFSVGGRASPETACLPHSLWPLLSQGFVELWEQHPVLQPDVLLQVLGEPPSRSAKLDPGAASIAGRRRLKSQG
ncbi:MAG: hypothetical protein ACK5JG_16730, partial [Pseudomonadota bacterium]